MALSYAAIDAPAPATAFERRAAQEKSVSKKGLSPFLLAGPPAAGGFDAWSTQQALGRGGVHEGNSGIYGDSPGAGRLYGTRIGTGLAASAAAQLLAKSGHRDWGKAVAILGILEPTLVGALNLKKGKR